MIPEDVKNKIRKDYGNEASEVETAIVEFIRKFTKLQPNEDIYRMVRCILYLSLGRKTKLHNMIDESFIDYRDIIYWAEYDPEGNKIRDLSKPFH